MSSLGPWGGPGGDHWSFNASLPIIEIVITLVRNNIHSISFRDASGYISGTFGGRDPIAIKRCEKKIGIHWPSEYLISISGTYGDLYGLSVIKSLSFITNLKTYGPFGTTSGDDTPFSIPTSNNNVVGFHGRAGYYVDALGIFVKPVDSHNGTISLGPWGGPGGDPFSFRVEGSWIKEIIVKQGGTINSIAFKDANGHYYGNFGGKDPNDTGVEKTVTINGPSELLKSISGTYGKYKGHKVIRSLSFITNLNTYGPFGTASGASFTIPIQGSLVIGFYGRAGYYLDSIGIIVQPSFVKPVDSHNGTISLGPWGGPGGEDPFSFRVQGSWIKEIIVEQGDTINSIAFKDADGHYYGHFGGKDPNDIGAEKKVTINGPSEYLTSISGTYGVYKGLQVIRSLSFITNLKTHEPFGTASGAPFTIPIQGSLVIGFYGRAGYVLDSIGIIVKPAFTN
ncbi:hypothetical protein QN277_011666 [Acacia crassicarpa]|uniref:Mannose/glucose-specific lectin n=1 Tax=Acacia crassicarpa TaxID=499986 RepID=A0AAE1TCK9_9FABA|nr:hypothetical protein QN277_011666 [Acacia crassicarpa]